MAKVNKQRMARLLSDELDQKLQGYGEPDKDVLGTQTDFVRKDETPNGFVMDEDKAILLQDYEPKDKKSDPNQPKTQAQLDEEFFSLARQNERQLNGESNLILFPTDKVTIEDTQGATKAPNEEKGEVMGKGMIALILTGFILLAVIVAVVLWGM